MNMLYSLFRTRRVCARIPKSLRIFIIPVLSNINEFRKKLLYFISTIYCNKYAKNYELSPRIFFPRKPLKAFGFKSEIDMYVKRNQAKLTCS